MDLKTYAVFRKLNKNSDLLKYVVNHQAVPLDVLNNDMKDLLDDLHDADAECVVNDYQKYLQEHVQMNFVPDGKDQFDVNGEVAEPLMESIELVHHVDRKDVVHDLVANVMNNLRGERDVKVDNIKLAASAKAFVALTKQPVLDVDTDQQTDDAAQTASESQTDESTQTDSEDQTDAATQMDSEAQTDAAIQMDSEDQTDDATQMNSEDQQVEDASVTDQNINYLKKPLPESNIQPEPPLFEEPDDDVPEDIEDILPEGIEDIVPEDVAPDNLSEQPVEEAAVETAEPQENLFRKAYDFLVDELKSRKIDERLPGLHLA